MNSANFHEYLRNPSMLHQVNYQELKSLVLQYPYSANLRYLMLVKSLLDGGREYDRNLVLASLGGIDRKKLRNLILQYGAQPETTENYAIAEEFLELKDLSTLEDILEAGPVATSPPKAVSLDDPVFTNSLEFLDELTGDTAEVVAGSGEQVRKELSEIEDLVAEDTLEEAPAVLQDDGLDDLFQMDRPLINRPPEPDDDPMDLEIEESLDGLFDESYEETGLASDDLDETAEAIVAADLAERAEEGNITEMEDLSEDLSSGESLEDEGTVAPSDVPMEVTNDEDSEALPMAEQLPTPKTDFSSFQKQYHPRRPGFLSGDINITPNLEKKPLVVSKPKEEPLEEPYKEPEDVAGTVAAESLSEDQTIATETLAGILARQGHYDKAIKMYEKLSLQFPEKSSTFAAKIEELKKK